MTLTLPPELEQLIQEKMATGHYNCPSEVVEEALWLLRDREELRKIRLAELKREIDKGLEAANRGELLDGEEVMARLRRRSEEAIRRAETAIPQ